MSPNKRRKVDEAPEQPQSAISALTARRRLAAAAVSREDTSPPEDEPQQRTGNSFSVLQRVAQTDRLSPKSPSTPKSIASRKDVASKRSVDKGASTPDSGASTPKVVAHSSFRLTKQNHRVRPNGVVELRLSEGERFIVLGSFGIRVRTGQIAMLGATLAASETTHWAHSPHCHALPVIRTLEKTHVELHSDSVDTSLTSLSALSPLYQRIWNEDTGTGGESFKILCTSEDAPKRSIIQQLNSPPEWNKAISDIMSSTEANHHVQLSALVCGPKSAGKSTFSKLLTNRLLTSTERCATTSLPGTGVAIIDLDPGQPEYAPAGTVSLTHVTRPNLGTPFSHPGLHQAGHVVVRCHALASTSPASSPSLYIRCATDLFETYQRTLRNCPLIINTPGWILGTGLDLLVELITKTMPSRVVYMSEDGPLDVVDMLRSATRKEFLTLPSQLCEYTTRTAAHLRAMQAMSYFHLADVEGSAAPKTLRWNPQPLSAAPPWQVRYGGRRSGIRGILSYDYQSPPELFAPAINGMVVAVVEIQDQKAFHDITGYTPTAPQETATTEQGAAAASAAATALAGLRITLSPEGLPMISNTNDATLDPCYSRTIGLALVRGIDVAARRLQLLTPIPHAQIRDARSQGHELVLVHGKFDAPTWAFAEDFFFKRATTAARQSDLDISYEDDDMDEDEEEEVNVAEDREKVEDEEEDDGDEGQQVHAIPWLEILQGNQKRPFGSRVWRVRRDLGRGTGG